MEDRIAALRARVAGLTPAERDIFRARIEAAGIDWARVAPVEIALRPARLPLSPGQMHFWLGQQVHPDSAAFSIAFAWAISGPLDVRALARALTFLVQRHEPLRTGFPSEDGTPWQQVTDLTFDLTEREVASDAEAIAAEKAFVARPFDLAQPPLFRAELLGRGADVYRLLLSFHHIIADGWSRGVFVRELTETYRAFHSGVAPQLPALTRQYADLVLDQKQWLTSPAAAAQEEFWRKELVDLATQELPAYADASDHRAESLVHDLDPALAAQAASSAAKLGVSPFTLQLAVFQLLLHRLTGSDDIAVGTPVAGRSTTESETMIGLFLNTLVLRGRPKAGMSFRDWLDQIRIRLLAGFENQELPFAGVVEAVGAERRVGQNPLFQVLFQVQSGYDQQNSRMIDLGDPRMIVRQEIIPLPDAKFDLSWHMMERDGGLSIIAEYRRGLFGPDQIRSMVSQFETLLSAALIQPDAAIETLDFVPEADAEILRGPDAEIPDLLTMFRDAAAESALVCAKTGAVINGGDLHDRALTLARRLRARPELADGAPLAICLPRGPQMVVALLAALHAGIPYIPLDPTHPPERRATILSDAGAGLILAQNADLAGCPVLSPDDLEHAPEAELPDPDPDRIAYVIFTSGSTGRPKGVPVTHRALSNLIASMADAPGMARNNRMLALTTIAFDIAALELFLPLATGATLVLSDAETVASPERLAEAIDRHAITHLQATPATWQLLISSGWVGNSRLVALSGGEALPSDLGRELMSRTGSLWNMYGPTETTIWSAARRLEDADLVGPNASIGTPVANTSLRVVDVYGATLPAGLPGELAIGGAGLSPGYWLRPDLTQERFISRNGERLYLTGDRVWLESSGTLTFLGRLDHQIKLNGYRIEPGEIEAALRAQSGIKEALVLSDGTRLIAYCRTDGAMPDMASLREELAKQLPAYMVPTAVVELDVFPLNPNGKIDRARLPKPDPAVSGGSRPPETPAEQILLEIWSEVLGRNDLGVSDNFFEIGGASVSAMQIASRARGKGLMLTPAQMFEHQTIAAQAVIAAAALNAPSETLPPSPWQRAMWEAPGAWRYLHLPVDGVDADRLAGLRTQLSVTHPVLRFGQVGEGWQKDATEQLWDLETAGDGIDLTAHSLLLDRSSLERLAAQVSGLLRGDGNPAAQHGRESYAEWLKNAGTSGTLEFAPLMGDGLSDGIIDPVVQHLDLATMRALRAGAQAMNVAPSRIVAAALARVLSPWAQGGHTLALIEDAPLDALGHFTRLLPLLLQQVPNDPANSLRLLSAAETACDPRGIDPRALPEGVAVLSWMQNSDVNLPINPSLRLDVADNADGLTLTWQADPRRFRAATVSRLSSRLLAGLAAPLAVGGISKLDRLRAKLTETR